MTLSLGESAIIIRRSSSENPENGGSAYNFISWFLC